MADCEQRTLARVSTRKTMSSELRILRVRGALPAKLRTVLGCLPPEEPGSTVADDVIVSWLAPGEWLVEGTIEAGEVEKACDGTLHHLADLGSGAAIFDIEGLAAGDLLNKGCSLDFHPRAFHDDGCARTILAGCNIFLRRAGPGAFRVMCDSSLSHHLDCWFEQAAREFQKDAGGAA